MVQSNKEYLEDETSFAINKNIMLIWCDAANDRDSLYILANKYRFSACDGEVCGFRGVIHWGVSEDPYLFPLEIKFHQIYKKTLSIILIKKIDGKTHTFITRCIFFFFVQGTSGPQTPRNSEDGKSTTYHSKRLKLTAHKQNPH